MTIILLFYYLMTNSYVTISNIFFSVICSSFWVKDDKFHQIPSSEVLRKLDTILIEREFQPRKPKYWSAKRKHKFRSGKHSLTLSKNKFNDFPDAFGKGE